MFASKDSLLGLEKRLKEVEQTCKKHDFTIDTHDDRISKLEQMNGSFSQRMDSLEDMINSIGSMPIPSSDTPGAKSDIDSKQVFAQLAKIQSELKLKVSVSDFDSLKNLLQQKTDKTEFGKEIKRLD
jgi:hypothetical protein